MLCVHWQSDVVSSMQYQRYTAQWNQSNLQVLVTPRYGDPDLFVRLDNMTVTVSNAQYSSTFASGVEVVTITPGDAAYQANCNNTAVPCTANIAVYGFTSSGYSIVATSGRISLIDGYALTGRVPVSALRT